MKKIYFKNAAIVAFGLCVVGFTEAQQTLQKITSGTNTTIVELYHLRNGTSNTNVLGSAGWNQDTSDTFGEDLIYLESAGMVYDQGSTAPLTTQSFPIEQIGNGTFNIATTPYTNNRAQKLFNWKSNGVLMPGGEFTLNTYNTDRDAVEDGNTNADLLHSKWVLPHTFDSGNPLPDGMWIILTAREGKKDTGGSVSGNRIGFRWNATSLQWIAQIADPAGDPFNVPQSSTLATQDFKSINASFHPNPVGEKLFVQLERTSDKISEFSLYSTTGQKVLSGNTLNTDQVIDVSKLAVGVYTLQLKVGDQIITHKIIKK